MPSEANEQPSIVAAFTSWTDTAVSGPDVGIAGDKQVAESFCDTGIVLRRQWGKRLAWDALGEGPWNFLQKVKTLDGSVPEAPGGMAVGVHGALCKQLAHALSEATALQGGYLGDVPTHGAACQSTWGRACQQSSGEGARETGSFLVLGGCGVSQHGAAVTDQYLHRQPRQESTHTYEDYEPSNA